MVGKLTVTKVRSAKPGLSASGKTVKRAYQDGDGLFLLVSPGGTKSWMLRVQVDGKRRDIGLGAADVDGLGREAFGADDTRYSDVPLMLRRDLSLADPVRSDKLNRGGQLHGRSKSRWPFTLGRNLRLCPSLRPDIRWAAMLC